MLFSHGKHFSLGLLSTQDLCGVKPEQSHVSLNSSSNPSTKYLVIIPNILHSNHVSKLRDCDAIVQYGVFHLFADIEIDLSPVYKTLIGIGARTFFTSYIYCHWLLYTYYHILPHDSRFISCKSWWIVFSGIKENMASVLS